MSNKVVFLRPDGSKYEAEAGSEEANILARAGYRVEGADELAARSEAEGRENYYSTPGEKIKAGIEGAASGITLGLSDRFFPDVGGEREARREYNPGVRTATELAGTVIAAIPSGGTSLGARAAASTPAGLVARGAEAASKAVGGGKILGRGAEGAVWGVAGTVHSSNVTGDALTVEAVVEGATLGGVLNVAVGALGDRLGVMGKKSVERQTARAAKEADEALIAERAARFEDPPPSWTELRGVHADAQKALKKENGTLTEEMEKYQRFLDEQVNDRLKTDVSAAINEVRSYYAQQANAAAKTVAKEGAENLPLHVRNRAGIEDDAAKSALPGQVGPNGELTLDAGRKVTWGKEGRRIHEAPKQVKPPMSEETAAWIRDIEERKSRALKLWGGGRDVEKGRWSKFDESIPADREAALTELRNIKAAFEQKFPQASAHFRELPLRPPPPKPFDPVDLPKSLLDVGRMNESQLERFIASAERSGSVREALERLSKDLDIGLGENAGDSVRKLHGVLSEHRGALSRLEAEEVKEAAKGGGILNFMRKTSKSAAKYAAGREVDRMAGYGWKGAILKAGTGAVLGAAMGNVEAGLLGAALLSGRTGTRSRIRDTVGARLEKTGALVTKLAPVTSYLSTRFPDGEKDEERDVRKRTVNRINEVILAANTAPDTMFYAVENMMGDESDIAWKLHQKVVGDLQYLVAVAPKDPGLDISLTGSRWTPSHQQVVEFAHVFEAVTNPMVAIRRALAGDGHPAAAEALWNRYPGLMAELATEFMARAPDMKIKYEHGGAFRDLFRVPITGLQQPVVVATLQGLYLPKPEAAGAQGSAPRGPSAGGKPPAIQSPVAGSSVSGLIS